MRRSLSLPIVALFSTVPVVAQTTGAGAPPPASKPQDATAATETRKTRRILTNEDLSKSTGKISVVGNGQDDKPKAAAPPKAANANPAYVASVRNQLEKLLKQMVDLDKQITDLKNFKAGEPSTNASGVRLDKRYAPSRIRRRICSPSSMRFMMKRGRRAFRPANSPDARKALRARTTIGTDLVSVLRGLFRFEADFLEHLRLAVKLRLPGRELVDVQQESQDVGVLLSRQTARLALRHGFADAVEKIAET